ncbi:hypothetical protein IKA92_04620 [bacterium]|nr:hypothetical protein [bacterium]
MKCFNHNDRDAFGVDVITGKGLCLECLEEYKNYIIEKDNKFSKCKVNEMVMKPVKSTFKKGGIALLLCGITLMFFYLLGALLEQAVTLALFITGAVFVLVGVVSVLIYLKKRKKN